MKSSDEELDVQEMDLQRMNVNLQVIDSLTKGLLDGFYWGASSEGHNYWVNVYRRLKRIRDLHYRSLHPQKKSTSK